MGTYIEYTPRSGGAGKLLFFDVTLSENHDMKAEITENPVEKGADVSDNYRPKLDEVTFEFFVSNAPIGTPWRQGSAKHYDLKINPRNENPDPLAGGVQPPKVIAWKKWENPLPFVGFESVDAQNVDIGMPQRNPLAQGVDLLTFDEFDAVAETVLVLRQIRADAMLCNVYSPRHDYTGMMLESFTMKRSPDDGTGAVFTLKFKEVRVVETKIVTAPKPVQPRGNGMQAKGAQGVKAVEDEKSSFARNLAQKIEMSDMFKAIKTGIFGGG